MHAVPDVAALFDPHTCASQTFQGQQILQILENEQISKEREQAINSVAESVTELAEIFKEIQVLVIDQGTVLDRIDFNIEQVGRVYFFVDELCRRAPSVSLCISCVADSFFVATSISVLRTNSQRNCCLQAAHRVGDAEKELKRANEYQKKSRTMLCIYLLLLLCGAMVIILILKKTL